MGARGVGQPWPCPAGAVHATLPTMTGLADPDASMPEGLQTLIIELEREPDPGRRDHLRARLDVALASYRAEQDWHIFEAQSDRAVREARDAQDRHKESLSAAEAHAMAASDHAKAANDHARALKNATLWLAVSTGVLAVATVVLVFVTAQSR